MDVRYWKTANGTCPVEDWLQELSHDHLKTALSLISRLQHFGVASMGRHSKRLTGAGSGLFELKDRPSGIRIYYCRTKSNSICLLLAAGTKESQSKDIFKAQLRRQQIDKGELE
jgi:putative addiction module killer protein